MPIIDYYNEWTESYFLDVISNGVTIKTSGTSGEPKYIFQDPLKIKADVAAAIKDQLITSDSKIYTCLSPERAGGLFAQTIPGLYAGADITLDTFDPYRYVKVVNNYTHTHLTPKQAKGVMKTKGFAKLDLTGKTFMCGSEPVTYDIIEAFVNQGAKFICIWGMTEVGPNAIMNIFNNIDDVLYLKSITPPNSTILGNIFNCDVDVLDDVLYVRGEQCVYDDWFNTGDTVIVKNDYIFYTGRKDTFVDFLNPKKG